ncbi:hypothetical protein GLAREA_11688 [Glarea lozoyensis ATCC 20868]|uniref:Uncharacterized protein n=1 Tax=Glarea lozoyensis (strain ATCC 20868 / MF5171) TaxID=1116229 RepID=S3CF31_GLAL2|nr:uncharacterized protein GLAREA_11688 [Glarea lozoyensis ATCC 20868]EPE25107.1 hypothetical protein GLAREA_11688 [Glarea lozoyensis ATCC 20868]
MPACAVHLISLSSPCTLAQFITALKSHKDIKPLTIARVVRWIILPSSISTSELLAQNIHWDLLLILPDTNPLPFSLGSKIAHQFTLQAGIPSRLLSSFAEKNERLLHPTAPLPELIGSLNKRLFSSSSQDLSLSSSLHKWVATFGQAEGSGAVSMLNFLAFKPGKKEEYLKYGAEFAKSIGSKRGGDAKLVGTVIRERSGGNEDRESKSEDAWDEMALAHYPSIHHFADMLASEDYQAVNQKFRVPSLKDTCILCTTELGIENLGEEKAKL